MLSFCEMAQPLVARLAERLGLPGNAPSAVDAARDKHATRVALEEAGLPTPRNFLITSPDGLPQVHEFSWVCLVLRNLHTTGLRASGHEIPLCRKDGIEHESVGARRAPGR